MSLKKFLKYYYDTWTEYRSSLYSNKVIQMVHKRTVRHVDGRAVIH